MLIFLTSPVPPSLRLFLLESLQLINLSISLNESTQSGEARLQVAHEPPSEPPREPPNEPPREPPIREPPREQPIRYCEEVRHEQPIEPPLREQPH